MPFYHNYSDENAVILYWKYDESDELHHNLLVPKEDEEKIKHYHPKKLLEYLMIRKLLKMELPNHKILYKSIGQPYLDPKDYYISITHSFPFAALAFSKKRVGIDLEKIMPKILRVKHKFLHSSEIEWIPKELEVDYLTIIWVIKEALYKLHPSKLWSLKLHYAVEPFTIDNLSEIKCKIFDSDFTDSYTASVRRIEGFYFAIIEENHKINFNISHLTKS